MNLGVLKYEKSNRSVWQWCSTSHSTLKSESILTEKKINAVVDAVDIKSLDQYVKQSDVYISITKPTKTYNIPTLNGIAFLTGMGIEAETQKLVDALK
jgi:PTS system galactitol-specific IIB component